MFIETPLGLIFACHYANGMYFAKFEKTSTLLHNDTAYAPPVTNGCRRRRRRTVDKREKSHAHAPEVWSPAETRMAFTSNLHCRVLYDTQRAIRHRQQPDIIILWCWFTVYTLLYDDGSPFARWCGIVVRREFDDHLHALLRYRRRRRRQHPARIIK